MSREHAAAGHRDRLVTIEQLTDGKGPSGYPTETWVTLAEVWMHKQDLTARERFSFTANQATAPYDTRWTMAYVESMDPEIVNVPKARRLIVRGRVHEIVGATEIGRKEGIELQTLAGDRVS